MPTLPMMPKLTMCFARTRGITNNIWLNSRHTFSFGDHYDPDNEGFRCLRVINEDRVQPSNGFTTHGHRNMEIITYVMAGALSHRDDLGNQGVIHPGEIQRMSAGRGILHSEFNASNEEPVHFLQIWITPAVQDGDPDYAQKVINPFSVKDKFGLMASRTGEGDSLIILQDANVWLTMLGRGKSAEFKLPEGRHGWVQMAKGTAMTPGEMLQAGDGASWTGTEPLRFDAKEDCEILVFDLP